MNNQGEFQRNQIDRFVNDQMDKEECVQFEQRMREHAGLAESVHMHRDVQLGIEYYFLKELKEKLIQSDHKKPKSRIGAYLAIAASVLVVVGLATTYLFLHGSGNSNDLFMAYFEPYPNIIAPVNRSENATYEDAMQFYEMGQYSEAIPKFNILISEYPERLGLVFYRGISYLGTNQPEKAAADFEMIIAVDKKAYVEPSRWYLGLSQLKMGKKADAKEAFKEVKNAGGAMATKADLILGEIG